MAMSEALSEEVKKAYILKQSVFTKFTDKEVDVLAELLTEQRFHPGETIVTEGDPVDSVYLIVEGTAEVQHVTVVEGKLHVEPLAQLTVGNSIGLGDTGFYSISGVRTATVIALTDMLLLRLSMPAFHGFALSYPHVNEVMRQNVAALETKS